MSAALTPDLPPLLHRGRTLSLRRTAPQDAAFLYANMYGNPEFLRLFRLNDTVASEAQLRDRLTRRLQTTPAQSGYLEMLISHAKHGAIGIVALADYSAAHRRTELLIGLFDRDRRTFSYGVEATMLVGDLAFNYYNIHRLYAYSYAYNDTSKSVMASGGFALEGVLKDHVFDTQTQAFVDLHLYALTRDRFRTNPRLARLSQRLVGRDITQPPPPGNSPVPPPQNSQSDRPTFTASGPMMMGRRS
ncbi:MAG: GNAT family protein [Cyanobacteria bacterium J06648_11]